VGTYSAIIVLHDQSSLRSGGPGSLIEVVLTSGLLAAQELLHVILAPANLASFLGTAIATISPEAGNVKGVGVKADNLKVYTWDAVVPEIMRHPILLSAQRPVTPTSSVVELIA
jgi:hypothetical protein